MNISELRRLEAGGLVERLRGTHTCDGCGEYVGSIIHDLCEQAADKLEELAAENERVRRERVEANKEWRIAFNNLTMKYEAAEARLAEALKALIEIETRPEKMIWGADHEINEAMLNMSEIARRVREGGKKE